TDIQALAFVRAGGLTYAASFALAILTGLVVGALPAWAAANVAVWSGRADGVRVAGDARGRVVRRMLNVAEVALALMLLAGAGLLLRTYMQLASRDLGFDPSGTVAVEVELGRARFPDAASRRAFVEPLAAAARQLPDVTHVALSVIVPPRGGLFFTVLETEGSAAPAEQTGFDGGIVSAGFFDTLRVPIVEGRGFVEADARESQRVIVVSKRTAAMLWPNGSAVGRRLRLDPSDPWSTVIGVAADVTSQSSSRDRPQIYVPLTPHQYDEAPTLIVRTAGDVDAVIAALRGQVAAIDPRVAISSIRTLDADVRGMNVRPRFNALLLGLLAAIGLVLAVTGIYGVINYSVGLRTRELGVRVALGASPAALGRSVIREAALVGTAGVAVGLGLWLIVGKGLASLLVGLGSTDVSTLAAVSAILLAATVLAAWLPARRAVRIDPVDALRAEG
ncbi:MAG TPA: ABC transporter permease, partial [Vicinamibacterales bacterium]|nr:ABC transporter permease [Vicinamibacterales bacterium]